MRHLLLLPLFILTTFLSCQKIEKHEPKLTHVDGEVDWPISNINIPILLEIQELEDLINQKVDGEIYNDNSFEGDNVIMSISKIGRIEVNLVGNNLYYKVPLNIWLEGRFEKKIIGKKKIKKSQKLDFSINLHFRSSLGINQDWKAILHTKLLKYEWIKKPKIKVAFFKIPITSLVEKQLDSKMDGLLSKIDASVYEKLDIKPMVLKLWTDIQKPIRINKKVTEAWLLAKPEHLYMSHIEGKKGFLKINLRLEASMQAILGDSPTVALNNELPPLLFQDDTSSRFNLYIKSTLPFKALNKALAQQVKHQELAWEEYKVGMENFVLMGSDSSLVLKVAVDGEINGDLYFKGKPDYDSLSQYLTLTDFDFDVSSEEVLLNTANWLLHDEVRDKVREELRLPLGDKLEKIPELIQNAIGQSKISKKLDVQLQNLSLRPSQILITSKDAQILVHATGNVTIEIEHLQ